MSSSLGDTKQHFGRAAKWKMCFKASRFFLSCCSIACKCKHMGEGLRVAQVADEMQVLAASHPNVHFVERGSSTLFRSKASGSHR